jgi:hypothetical protein
MKSSEFLKPEGRFAILDFRHVEEYATVFKELGAAKVEIIGLHYFIFRESSLDVNLKSFNGNKSKGLNPDIVNVKKWNMIIKSIKFSTFLFLYRVKITVNGSCLTKSIDTGESMCQKH